MTGIVASNTDRQSGLLKASAGASNQPYFHARRSADYNFSDNTYVIMPIDEVITNAGSCYDNSTYKFTPNVAGNYYIYCNIEIYGGTTDRINHTRIQVYKNSSSTIVTGWSYSGNEQSSGYTRDRQHSGYCSAVVAMNGSSDWLAVYCNSDESSHSPWMSTYYESCFFGGFKIA